MNYNWMNNLPKWVPTDASILVFEPSMPESPEDIFLTGFSNDRSINVYSALAFAIIEQLGSLGIAKLFIFQIWNRIPTTDYENV